MEKKASAEKAAREIRRKTRRMPQLVDAAPEPSWRQRAERWMEADAKTIPGARWLRTGLRTLHLIAVGALYGGHLYAVDTTRLHSALFSVLLTGGLLVCFEVWQARIWLVQVRGVATFFKLGLLAGISLALDLTVALLTLALVIGSISSHMPSRWRYHSVLHGCVAGPTEKG
jgi:hypothetical protein